ncbi:MAG: isochorismatase family protein [Fimbriimonadaceae bacterium]|nr:isochorismatase family protein [Fimbriimonadaceae bacterium]
MSLRAEESVVVIVDMQPTFLAPIHQRERVLSRCQFIAQVARRLEVPVVATAQYPDRMGGVAPEISGLLHSPVIGKMSFSCCGEPKFNDAIDRHDRAQVVLCGVESHICVTQTALDLLGDDHDVFVVADAVSARSAEMHDVALQRLRDVGVEVVHSESVAYEWLGSAEHEAFRDVLALVKGQ